MTTKWLPRGISEARDMNITGEMQRKKVQGRLTKEGDAETDNQGRDNECRSN